MCMSSHECAVYCTAWCLQAAPILQDDGMTCLIQVALLGWSSHLVGSAKRGLPGCCPEFSWCFIHPSRGCCLNHDRQITSDASCTVSLQIPRRSQVSLRSLTGRHDYTAECHLHMAFCSYSTVQGQREARTATPHSWTLVSEELLLVP